MSDINETAKTGEAVAAGLKVISENIATEKAASEIAVAALAAVVPEVKPPTPEEIAATRKAVEDKRIADFKAAQEKINARIKELQGYAGKSFKRKDGTGGVIKIEGYAGIHQNGGRSFHCFQVETPGARWTPPATQFLEEHDEVQVNEVKPSTEVI